MQENSSYTPENTVEGPRPIYKIELSYQDYINQIPPSHINWLYQNIISQLPDGEIKSAMVSASQEIRLRREQGGKMYSREAISPDSKQYAFRCFTRNSENKPHYLHPTATQTQAIQDIYSHGIEAISSPTEIMPCVISENHVDPEFHNTIKLDLSYILVYQNRPFVVPNDEAKPILIDINDSNLDTRQKEISLSQAKNYPTIRDIHLGTVEIHWKHDEKPKPTQSRFAQHVHNLIHTFRKRS